MSNEVNNLMRFREIINEGRDAALFVAFRNITYAEMAIRDNRLAGTSSQRWWEDGRRLKDNDPEYDTSYWMKGVSTSRDIHYCMAWGDVIFELDQTKIAQRYKIIPFNWGFSIPSENHHKREREEFIITRREKDRYKDDADRKRFQSPEGYVEPLSGFLKGIYISTYATKMKHDQEIDALAAHPKFKGYYVAYYRDDTGMSGTIYPPGANLDDVTTGMKWADEKLTNSNAA